MIRAFRRARRKLETRCTVDVNVWSVKEGM